MVIKNKKQKAYDGKYDDVMEGEHLITMRKAIENLAAGKINKKQYNEIKKGFLNEFPESAIKIIKKDIAEDRDAAAYRKGTGLTTPSKN